MEPSSEFPFCWFCARLFCPDETPGVVGKGLAGTADGKINADRDAGSSFMPLMVEPEGAGAAAAGADVALD